jgi:formate-dependent nitrite reductase membrane component NrfD
MDKNISFGQALHYCAGTSSYWWGIVIVLFIAAILVAAVIYYQNKKGVEVNPVAKVIGAFAIVVAIFIAVLGRPANIAANTTQEQAARGVYIGY